MLTAFTALPNGQADEDLSNDTVRMNLNYTDPVTSVSEGFELNSFPPQDWDIVNRDRLKTWEKVNGVSKSGSYAVMMNNYNYEEPGQKDDLRLPGISLSSTLDSAFLTFQVAAATFTHPSTTQGIWDTLEVLASTDCGITYTSLYKKWGSSLVTRPDAATAYFTPPPPPESFTVGVTDVRFNPTNAIFGRLLKTRENRIVTLAYWYQKEKVSNDEIPYFD